MVHFPILYVDFGRIRVWNKYLSLEQQLAVAHSKKHYRHLFTVEINKITVQPSKYKPVSLKAVELEVLRFKRALVRIAVREGERESRLLAVIEFRGRGLTLSRTEGDCSVEEVGRRLGLEFYKRYNKEGLRLVDDSLDPGKTCEYTVEDPMEFLAFLHLIKNRGTLEVYGQTNESSHINMNPLGLPHREPTEFEIQLADRVYTPLLREIATWEEPIAATFHEWKRLEQEERLRIKKVPKPITDLINQAWILFESKTKLTKIFHSLISTRINSYAPAIIGLDNAQDMSSIEFRLVGEHGGSTAIYIPWIWQAEEGLRNYVLDIVGTNFPAGTRWHLETWVYPRPSGTGRLVGKTKETEELINKVLSSLMFQEVAQQVRTINKEVKQIGKKLLSLIDAELGKD